jgi:hypothetical protein
MEGALRARSTSHEMQYEHDQANNQDNMNQTAGNVKCKKTKQPENNQNRGDYRKHFPLLFSVNCQRISSKQDSLR